MSDSIPKSISNKSSNLSTQYTTRLILDEYLKDEIINNTVYRYYVSVDGVLYANINAIFNQDTYYLIGNKITSENTVLEDFTILPFDETVSFVRKVVTETTGNT